MFCDMVYKHTKMTDFVRSMKKKVDFLPARSKEKEKWGQTVGEGFPGVVVPNVAIVIFTLSRR